MFANVYGSEGIRKAINLMKNEIVQDGWNLGIGSLDDLEPSLVCPGYLIEYVNSC